jgi:acyl-CoA reductase-like NAD-dependent aldehyde dehydrogenase
MPELVKNYIGGQWVAAESGATFASINPATEAVLAEAADCGPADVAAAVEAAK